MMENKLSFLAKRNTLVVIILSLVSIIILLSSYMIQNGQFTFLNRASSSWNTAPLPPTCSGTWELDTSTTHNGIDIKESYTVTYSSGKNIVLYDWDNDPKIISGTTKEIGHIFKINGVEYKVPEQDPANDDQWSTISLSNVTRIEYSRNADSGGSNICVLGAATTPTRTPTPSLQRTPTPTSPFLPCPPDVTSGWPECRYGQTSYNMNACRSRAEDYKGVSGPTNGTETQWFNWAQTAPKALSCGTACGLAPSFCIVSATPTPSKTPTKTPTPSVTRTPTGTPPRTPTPLPSGQLCQLDADIVLVIDRSSSMNSKETDDRTKLEWAKEAATNLVDRIANTSGVTAKVGIVSFGAQGNDGSGTKSSSYNSTLHIAPSANYASVKTAISNVKYIESGTCIECGLRIANGQLTSATRNRVVILLSDGRANHNWTGTSSDATAKAIAAANTGRSSGIVYYVLGYGTNVDADTLTSIAGNASRYRYKPNATDWPTAFLSILDQVCTEIPTPTPSRSPSNTPAPSPTRTPTPQPTNQPSSTPTKTPTKTPTPQPTNQPSHTPTPTVPACIIPPVQNVRITCPICNL